MWIIRILYWCIPGTSVGTYHLRALRTSAPSLKLFFVFTLRDSIIPTFDWLPCLALLDPCARTSVEGKMIEVVLNDRYVMTQFANSPRIARFACPSRFPNVYCMKTGKESTSQVQWRWYHWRLEKVGRGAIGYKTRKTQDPEMVHYLQGSYYTRRLRDPRWNGIGIVSSEERKHDFFFVWSC